MNLQTVQLNFSKQTVKHYSVCCAIYWLILLGVSIFIALGGYFALDPIKIDDFLVSSNQDTLNKFALDDALSKTTFVSSTSTENTEVKARNTPAFFQNINFLYELDETSNTLFTPKTVKQICETENLIFSLPEYKSYCLTEEANGENTVCSTQFAALSSVFYLGIVKDCVELSQSEINSKLSLLDNSQQATSFVDDIDRPTIARSQIFLGGPLGNDTSPFQDFETISTTTADEQGASYVEFLTLCETKTFTDFNVKDGLISPAFSNSHFQKDNSDLKIRMYGYLLEQMHFQKVVIIDQQISMASFIAVSILVYRHVRSYFLTFCAMIAISTSLTAGLFIYELVMQFKYFNNLHLVTIYLILGIGADNFFVFIDSCRQNNLSRTFNVDEEKEYIKSFNKALWRATSAVANTALTTGLAFAATGVSPVKPVAAFGFYAAVVIFVNFLYMMTIYPTTFLFYTQTMKPIFQNIRCLAQKKIECLNTSEKVIIPIEAKKCKITELYLVLIEKKSASVAMSTVFLLFGSAMLFFASKLETPVSASSNFKPSHMFTGFMDVFETRFRGGTVDAFSQITQVFGIEDIDTSMVKKFSAESSYGEATFDTSFSIESKESQDFLNSLCTLAQEFECETQACNYDTLFIPETINCFMEDFKTWHNTTHGDLVTYTSIEEVSTSLTSSEFNERLKNFLTSVGSSYTKNFGYIGDRLSFFRMIFRNSIKQFLPLQIKADYLEELNLFKTEVENSVPATMKSYFQTSFDIVWAHTEQGLVDGLFKGMAISAVACYLILLFGTKSFSVATFALLGVSLIVGCVLGNAYLLGWSLGTTEAIAGVMVIGLSVDYTVHLGHMLMLAGTNIKETERITRFDAVRYSVENMGGTVIAGAITTLSSGIFLFLCNFGFFVQMATLITLTVLYSVLFAFGFFLPLCRLMGPLQKGKLV